MAVERLALSATCSMMAVTKVPVMVIDELEIREGELPLQQFGELILDGLCPLAYQHNKLINVPGYTTTYASLDVRCLM